MNDPQIVAAYTAAIVAVLGAITTLILAVRPIKKQVSEVHQLVNSQHDAAIAQQTRTDNALRAAGIPIPDNPAADIQVSGSEPEPWTPNA